MPCTLNCRNKFSLMLCTRSRDAFGNYLALLGYESLQFLLVLIVDVDLFIVAKSTRSATLNILLRLLRTSSLMLYSHSV